MNSPKDHNISLKKWFDNLPNKSRLKVSSNVCSSLDGVSFNSVYTISKN